MNKKFSNLTILYGLLVIVVFLIENKIMVGGFLPIISDPVGASKMHAKALPGFSLLTGAVAISSVFIFVQFLKTKEKKYLLLAVMVSLLPLTRLGRADVVMGIVGMTVAYFTVNPSISFKVFIKLGSMFAFILIVFSYLGDVRTNNFGQFQFSYAEFIQYSGVAGPFELFAVLYGYFCLPFEVLNNAIVHMGSYCTYGMLSFKAMFVTLFELDNLDGYVTLGEYHENLHGLLKAAVATSMDYFYMDFRLWGAWLPMLVFFLFWFWLFLNRSRSEVFLVLYSYYSGIFSLASFQAQMTTPATFREMIVFIIVYSVISLLAKHK